jgi:hypothetical protein
LYNFLGFFFFFYFMTLMAPKESAVWADALFTGNAGKLVHALVLLTNTD